MYELCRHIMPNNKHCGSPAIKGQLFCFNHQNVKRALAKVAPKPDPYGIYTPLPFTFPEDRAALQLNYMLVLQALNDRSIHLQMANAFNRILRSCEMNLSHGLLTETDPENPAKDIVQHVILTPQGEEIAPSREVLEEGEDEPIHGPTCPCSVCAEHHRNAPLEEHHPTCKCGLCEEPSSQDRKAQVPQLTKEGGDQPPAPDQESSVQLPELRAAEERDPPSTLLRNRVTHKQFRPRAASRQSSDFDEAIFGEHIREYKTEQAEIARAAREAGLRPPPHKPWDNTMYKSEAERRYEQHREQIRKNQQAAREAWIKHHPDIPPEEPCLSWGEEHDRKLAAMNESPGSNSPQFSASA